MARTDFYLLGVDFYLLEALKVDFLTDLLDFCLSYLI
jgi:hypothetical protein